MTTLEGNKLIAEFMGMERTGKETRDTAYKQPGNSVIWASQLLYHISWDWIIPVIRKAKASEHSSNWPGWELLNIELLKCHKPEDLIPDVIDFIQWYNQNKPA